jgi:hypothetical protein
MNPRPTPDRARRWNGSGIGPFLMMREPEIWREIALYFLATFSHMRSGLQRPCLWPSTVRTISMPSAPNPRPRLSRGLGA